MTIRRFALAGLVLLLTGILFANETTDWVGTATNPEIQYRSQVLENAQACALEFRDQQQGRGSTTFDAEVDYKSITVDSEGHPLTKTDRENIVVTPTQAGNSQIASCAGVLAVRLSFVQRN
jgi:hypothetical protein